MSDVMFKDDTIDVKVYDYLFDGFTRDRYREGGNMIVKDIPSMIQEYCNVLSITLTKKNILQIASECSIDNTIELANKTHNSFTFKFKEFLDRVSFMNMNFRTLLVKLGMPSNMYDKRTLLHKGHISKNKGQSGIWRNSLTKLEVEMLENRYGSWLTETGYMA